MKNLFKVAFLLFAAFAISSCSSDDDSGNGGGGSNFKLDGQTYDMSQAQPNGGVIQIIGGDFGEEGVANAQISLTGLNGTKSGIITFHLSFLENEGISGTYNEGTWDEVGAYDSEGSIYMTNETVNGSQEIQTGEGAEGTFKITHNSDNNYTIEFNVTYDDGVQAEGNITQEFFVQQI